MSQFEAAKTCVITSHYDFQLITQSHDQLAHCPNTRCLATKSDELFTEIPPCFGYIAIFDLPTPILRACVGVLNHC